MSIPRFSTPVRGIVLMGAVSLVGSLTMRFQLVVELLNFGAFVGFILVNLSVIRHYYFRLGRRRGFALFSNLLFPLAGALVCAYVWLNLTWKAHLAGFCWPRHWPHLPGRDYTRFSHRSPNVKQPLQDGIGGFARGEQTTLDQCQLLAPPKHGRGTKHKEFTDCCGWLPNLRLGTCSPRDR